jgi:hypothetical protein
LRSERSVGKVAVPRHLKDHIQSIQESLRQTAKRPSRPSAEELAPHVAMLIELGYTDDEINTAFGWEASKRYLRKIKQTAKLDGSGSVLVQSVIAPERLDAEYREMLEFKPEAFIAFYDRFNYQPMPEHCKEWVYEAFENDLLLLNVPPRHNKSTLFAIWWPLWNIVRDRDTQVLVVSATQTLSSRWVGYIASYLSFGEIPQIFGRFKPETQEDGIPWRPSKGEIMVVGRERGVEGAMQYTLLSRSTGSQLLGFEADIIVADDLTSKRVAISPTQRNLEIEWFQEECTSRMNPEGRALVIGQRVHLNDLYGYLGEQVYEYGPRKDEPIWTHIVHPAIEVWPQDENWDDAEVLWPGVWPYERLMKSYALVGGKSAFQTMYQQDPAAGDASLVREEWLEACRDKNRKVGPKWREITPGQEVLPVVRVASLDPSPTMYNGLVIADVVYSRDTFFCVILHIASFKSDWRGIRQSINAAIDTYRPDYFLFEKNIAQYWASGDPFIEELRGKTTVLEHSTSAHNKFDVETGLESLSYDFEMANVRLPYGDHPSAEESRLLETELRTWTREGRIRDDVLMALWFIKFNYKRLIPRQNMVRSFRGGTNRPNQAYRNAQAQQNTLAARDKLRQKRSLLNASR